MKDGKLKIIIGVTGASGAIYARLLITRLAESQQVEEVAVVMSRNGEEVAQFEGEPITSLAGGKIIFFDNEDMFSPVASGSSNYDAMVVVPCSAGAVGRIANGLSTDLIARAADVMLKERRRLVVVVREAPFNTIQLRNMLTLSECGAVVFTASPSFYSKPRDIEQLCMTIVERVVVQLGVDMPRFEWGENQK